MMEVTEVIKEINFSTQHSEADMSKVDKIRVNGKEFVAIDHVLEVIDDIKAKELRRLSPDPTRPEGYIDRYYNLMKKYKEAILTLKEGDKE